MTQLWYEEADDVYPIFLCNEKFMEVIRFYQIAIEFMEQIQAWRNC